MDHQNLTPFPDLLRLFERGQVDTTETHDLADAADSPRARVRPLPDASHRERVSLLPARRRPLGQRLWVGGALGEVFAANVLMTLDDYRRQIDAAAKVDLDMISQCGERYRVSLIAGVLR
jgi:hypothetical protein